MTSKLVVNTIEADTGISSVSFASSISLSSTSKFFFSDAGINIGPDTNINRPATGVLGSNINSGTFVFNSTTVNIGGGFNTSTGKFTVPVGGTYFFSTNCLTSSNADANDLQIRVDDTNIAQSRADVGSAAHNTVSISVIATLTANQVVEVFVAGGSGFYSGTGKFATFCGYLIG